jgi:hypothetical protein
MRMREGGRCGCRCASTFSHGDMYSWRLHSSRAYIFEGTEYAVFVLDTPCFPQQLSERRHVVLESRFLDKALCCSTKTCWAIFVLLDFEVKREREGSMIGFFKIFGDL